MELPEIEFNKKVEKIAQQAAERVFLAVGFTKKKIAANPTDNLGIANRQYVNLNGTVSNRPAATVATLGQRYFATDTNIPMTFNGTNWVNGVGSVVAAG